MTKTSLYIKWLKLRFDELNNSQNRKWLLLYVIFSLSGFFGVHLVFLKKYKKAIAYLMAWILIIGSIVALQYRPVPYQYFLIGILFLSLLILIDIFNIYFVQPKRMRIYLPLILFVFLFSLQLFFYEYLIQQNAAFIKKEFLGVADRFTVNW